MRVLQKKKDLRISTGLIHHAAVRVDPGINGALFAENLRVDGTAALLPHVEFAAGAAQRLVAAVADNNSPALPADPARPIFIRDPHRQ